MAEERSVLGGVWDKEPRLARHSGVRTQLTMTASRSRVIFGFCCSVAVLECCSVAMYQYIGIGIRSFGCWMGWVPKILQLAKKNSV